MNSNVLKKKQFLIVALMAIFGSLLLLSRSLIPERPISYTGLRAVYDACFALCLWGLVFLLAAGIGLKVLRWFNLNNLTRTDRAVFGLAIGFGIIAYGVTALGLVRFLQPWAIVIWLIIIAIISWREWSRVIGNTDKYLHDLQNMWQGLSLWKTLILIAIIITFFLFTFYALAPPIDTDGLADHLYVPKLFLQANRYFSDAEIRYTNYPFTIESLFVIGMAFGSDTFPKLIHLSLGALVFTATYSVSRRYLGSNGGWISTTILLGMPIIPVWSSMAYIDMGWTLYELLAIYAIILWSECDSHHWLILSGIFTGLAMGSKYLAVAGFIVVGIWIIWHKRSSNLKKILVSGMIFGVTAILIASPWYLRNWIWSGNPVYPFFSSATNITLATKNYFGFWDYLALPWHLYVNRLLFVGGNGIIEFLSPFFLLVFIFPWTNRSKPVKWLAILTLIRYILWAIVSHHRIRYMLPVIPMLSILSASVIVSLFDVNKFRRLLRVLIPGLMGGLIVITLFYSMMFFVTYRPLGVVLGLESKDSFLINHLSDYGAIKFAKTELPADSSVYMLWDSRGYYCDERCVIDYQYDQWVKLTQASNDITEVITALNALEITHLLLDIDTLVYFIEQIDRSKHQGAMNFFLYEFRPACTKELFKNEHAILYEYTCTNNKLLGS